ncbi:matrixin family metalloprotease, partial [Spirulina sp. CS-785/01]|uniref:matrixin family metalloprotease n=1 Tax=Spirulina sp. CS-785/01 TaxID=3021716 RepID=UPI00233131CE
MPIKSINPSGKNQIDALLSQNQWEQPEITYSFLVDSAADSYYGSETVREVNEDIKANVRFILEQVIEPFINIDFVEVDDSRDNYGQFRYMFSDGPSYAYAYYPSGTSLGGDVHLTDESENNSWNNFSDGIGNHGYHSLIHETGHALGLKHPNNYSGDNSPPFLPFEDDHTTNTVMSYNTPGRSAATLMPYDLQALQYLYGAKAFNDTQTTYSFAEVSFYNDGTQDFGTTSTTIKQTLYDSGGEDVLDFSNLAFEAGGYHFDLNENGILTTKNAYNSADYQANGDNSGTTYTTSSYGTAIAFNTIIENVITSSSDDWIIANGAANRFSGYTPGVDSGDDTLFGTDATDTLDLSGYTSFEITQQQDGGDLRLILAGDGSITIKDYFNVPENERITLEFADSIIYGTPGPDNLYGTDGNETIDALADDDDLYGEAGDDILYGRSGNDRLEGGEGNDELYGGDGNDSFFDGDGDNRLEGGAGDDEFYIDGTSNNTFTGYTPGINSGNDIIWDNNNNPDTLDLSGYSFSTVTQEKQGLDLRITLGEDGSVLIKDYFNTPDEERFTINFAESIIYGTPGRDDLQGTAGNDTIDGLEGNDRLFGKTGDDILYGRSGDDKLYGEQGDDELYGGTGNDKFFDGGGSNRLDGGAGDDEFILGSGNSTLTGYAPGVDSGNDVLWLSAAENYSQDTLDLSAYHVSELTQEKQERDLLLTLGGDGSVLVKGYFEISPNNRLNIELDNSDITDGSLYI